MPSGSEVDALVLSYAGIVLVFGRDLTLSGDPHALWLGAALVFAGVTPITLKPRSRAR